MSRHNYVVGVASKVVVVRVQIIMRHIYYTFTHQKHGSEKECRS